MTLSRALPHPLLSLALLLVWLALVNSLAPGQIVLGLVLALAIPRALSGFWPSRPHVQRPLVLFRLVPVVLYDIVVANLIVAALILSPARAPRPHFIELPLDLTDEFAITVLASIITLTPGTLSADLAPDRRHLLIHGLDIDDPETLVASIKARYERPLKEIFEC